MNNYIIVTTARNEEQFLDEWVDYHLNLGFDHIYICDNNDEPLQYDHKNVTVYHVNNIDFSQNIYKGQCESYQKVLDNLNYKYCCIIDVDEFLELKTCKNIQEFVEKYVSDVVDIPWEVYDDNDLIFHIDKPVRKLYPNIQNKMNWDYEKNECSWSKSIFKYNINIKPTPHYPKNCRRNLIDKSIAVVRHYRTKCLEDYIKHKCLQQNAVNAIFTGGNVIQTYFDINNINLDKLIWALRFCKDCNYPISTSDRYWVLNQFEKFSPITIVIRTYNRLKHLKHCLKLLKKQTRSCKILVLNDGSQDNTSKWLSNQSFDFLSLKNNVGPGEILSRGKYLITTPYYIILDDDDEWINTHTIEFFYNNIIDNPYLDMLQPEKAYHAVCLINTELLLNCPNLSLFAKDDYYFYWIRNHAKNIVRTKFSFYNYRSDLKTEYHVNYKPSLISIVACSFFKELNLENMSNYIYDNYHKYELWERKVADQILNNLSQWVG